MKQALHIFRKDARHLWPNILVALILVCVHAAIEIRRTPVWMQQQRFEQMAMLAAVLLTLSWWSLIAAAVHEEALPGDRQFWVTRPYSWPNLMQAKLLFIAAFVNLPLLISDCFILGVRGFPVLPNLPDLLVRQIPTSFWLVLPALALAALTAATGQFIPGAFVVLIGVFAESSLLQSQNVFRPVDSAGQWIVTALIFAVGGAVIVWQYAKRRTLFVRLFLLAFVFIILPPLDAIPGWNTLRLKGDQDPAIANVRVAYDFTNAPIYSGEPKPDLTGNARLLLPLKVSGLKPDRALIGNGRFSVYLETKPADLFGNIQKLGDQYFESVQLSQALAERLQHHHANLYSALSLAIVTTDTPLRSPVWKDPISVPHVGVCKVYESAVSYPYLWCFTAVRPTESVYVTVEYPGFRSEPVNAGTLTSGYQVFAGLSPVQQWSTQLLSGSFSIPQQEEMLANSKAELVFRVQWPQAWMDRSFSAEHVDLSPYLKSDNFRTQGRRYNSVPLSK